MPCVRGLFKLREPNLAFAWASDDRHQLGDENAWVAACGKFKISAQLWKGFFATRYTFFLADGLKVSDVDVVTLHEDRIRRATYPLDRVEQRLLYSKRRDVLQQRLSKQRVNPRRPLVVMDAAFATQMVGEDFVDGFTTRLPTVRAVLGLLKLGTQERLEVVIYDLRR